MREGVLIGKAGTSLDIVMFSKADDAKDQNQAPPLLKKRQRTLADYGMAVTQKEAGPNDVSDDLVDRRKGKS